MLSQAITIIGYATVDEEHREIFLAHAEELVAHNRGELGCMQSIILQDMHNPNKFILHEIWENQDAWTTHLQQKHLAEFIETSNILGKDLQLHKYKKFEI